MLARKFHIFKTRGITAIATVLSQEDAETAAGVSSRADTWLLLRSVESTGERKRLLFVCKQRGSAHSNQVREFVLTDHGIELADVYVGPDRVLTGSARLSQESGERDARLRQREELAALQDELGAQQSEQQSELMRTAGREERLAADSHAARQAMGTPRWADPDQDDDKEKR